MPNTRLGEAIQRLLDEAGWTKKDLAVRAHVRQNTLTNIITHGKGCHSETMARIAKAFNKDISELLLTREQSSVLRSHQDNLVDRVRETVVKELSDSVTEIVRRELGASPAGERKGKKKRKRDSPK